MLAEAWATAIAGAFLSSFLNVLFDRLATVKSLQPLTNVFKKTNLRYDLLQKMEILLLRVGKVLEDAEEKQIMSLPVKQWVDKLKEAAYDAEDLLDAIAMAVEGQVWEEQIQIFNTRLEAIVSKLNLIAEENHILVLKEGPGGKFFPRLPTTSLIDKYEECFRHDDKKLLLDVLLSDGVERKGIPTIAIIGMGGIGKTTLAQFLYSDVGIKKYFNLTAWVYVSENFDVFKVTKTIYESITFSHFDIEDLNTLQIKLEHELMEKKFLLVLDNVWNESARDWDLLLRPLQVGASGSKMIVTTRSQSVSSIMHNVLVHNLKTLSKEDSWSLFVKHAFGDADPEEDSTLKAIGEKIVTKCKGLPLAIKTLGCLLYSQDDEEWNNILNDRIWDLPHHKSDILPALRLSYHYLPSQLKRCFVYCSIFPKGHKFEKQDLVRMWIAEGFVQQPSSRKSTRGKQDVGEHYFDELVARSIFQPHDHGTSCFFTMHDLLNDLAQHVAGEFCFQLEDDSTLRYPAMVRHLSCTLDLSDTAKKFEAFYVTNKVLRTFILLQSEGSSTGATLSSSAFKGLFPSQSCLRVLSLPSKGITKFPDLVCNLKQLRYLDLSYSTFQHLPKDPKLLPCLRNLETLKLSGCPNLRQLPSILSKLTKLEHLDIKNAKCIKLVDLICGMNQLSYVDLSGTGIEYLPEGVCNLKNLQTLKLSRCNLLTHLPTNLNQLTKLKYFDIRETPLVELLDSIGNLKQLGYLDLSGTKIQALPEAVCKLKNLKTLKLSDCSGLSQLPTDISNLTKLKHLDIEGTSIMQMPPNVANLKRLHRLTTFVVGNNSGSAISELKNLSLLRGTFSILQLQNVLQTADAEEANLKHKMYLHKLIYKWGDDPCNGNVLATCNPPNRNIENTVNLPSNGRVAVIVANNNHIGNSQIGMDDPQNNNGQRAEDGLHIHKARHAASVLDKLRPGKNLETLEIINFFGMTFPKWLGDDSFSKLKNLTLQNCQNCTKLPPLGQLPSLEELVMLDLNGLEVIGPEFYGDGIPAFRSLRSLMFRGMENWEQWLHPANREFASQLKLYISNCKKLIGDTPELPKANLYIEECNALQI